MIAAGCGRHHPAIGGWHARARADAAGIPRRKGPRPSRSGDACADRAGVSLATTHDQASMIDFHRDRRPAGTAHLSPSTPPSARSRRRRPRSRPRPRGVHRPRVHRHDVHARAPQLAAQALGRGRDAGLRRAVVGHAGGRGQAGKRRHVDDRAGVAREHRRQHRADERQWGQQVDLHQRSHRGDIDVGGRRHDLHSGVVDQHIDGPELGHRAVDPRRRLRRVAEVRHDHPHRVAELGLQRVELGRVHGRGHLELRHDHTRGLEQR